MLYPTLGGTSGRLLWWFAVELDEPETQNDPKSPNAPVPASYSQLSLQIPVCHRLAPSPFKHFEEVIEHEKVMLYAEIADEPRILLPPGIAPPVESTKTPAIPTFLSGPATLGLSEQRIFATLESGEYYELTLPTWVSNRMFRLTEVEPDSAIYEAELKSPRYAETDTLIVTNKDDPERHSPVKGRTFYRLTSSPWA